MSAKVKTKVEDTKATEKPAVDKAKRGKKRAISLAGTVPIVGKASDRYPCGKIRPEIPPTKIKRVMDSALMRAENPFLGAPLGWLNLHGFISIKQLAAGIEYTRLRLRYDRLMGLPRRSSRKLGMPDMHDPISDQEARAICGHFNALYDRLIRVGYPNVGTKLVSLLDDTCIDLVNPPYAERELLRIGLDKIAEYFRMSAPPPDAVSMAQLSNCLCAMVRARGLGRRAIHRRCGLTLRSRNGVQRPL